MNEPMLNHRMKDGSRQFAKLPQTVLWQGFADHMQKLNGLRLAAVLTDHVTEGWIDFTFDGYEFSVNDQFGDYWFFVNDPTCADDVLRKVLSHASTLLKRRSG